jgi:hypothetical protein
VCARFTLRKEKLRVVADALDAEFSADDEPLYRPRFNVAPTDLAWVVEYGADRRVLRPATWNYVVSGGPDERFVPPIRRLEPAVPMPWRRSLPVALGLPTLTVEPWHNPCVVW